MQKIIIRLNAIPFVLPFEEISILPELSIPPCFRIKEEVPPERDGAAVIGVTGLYFPFLI